MPERPAPLRDMIKRAIESGAEYRGLAAQAQDPDTGTRASLGYLNKLANGKVERIPDDRHLAAIAAALAMPFEIVWLAATVQWMPVTSGPLEEALEAFYAVQIEAYERRQETGLTSDAQRAEMIAEALRAIAAAHRQIAEQRRQQAC